MKTLCAISACFAVLLAACSQTTQHFDLISFSSNYTKAIPADFEDTDSITFTAYEGEPINQVYVDTNRGILLYLPPWPQFEGLNYAVKLHETLGLDCIGLRDVRMEYSGWYFPIFYTSETCRVTGTPLYVTKKKNAAKKRRAK